MVSTIKKAPKFTAILGGDPLPGSSSVLILVSTEDNAQYALEFDCATVPIVVSGLMGMQGKVISALPEASRPSPANLNVESVTFVTNDKGQVGLLVTLVGGAEFTFEVPTSELVKFRNTVDEAISASRSSAKQ